MEMGRAWREEVALTPPAPFLHPGGAGGVWETHLPLTAQVLREKAGWFLEIDQLPSSSAWIQAQECPQLLSEGMCSSLLISLPASDPGDQLSPTNRGVMFRESGLELLGKTPWEGWALGWQLERQK